MVNEKFVSYEDFGAVGDGEHDDMPAIVAAHAHANETGLPVKAKDGATYYIGGGDLTAVIMTDTDFGTAKFIIDDRRLDNVKANVFHIKSAHESYTPEIHSLAPGQRTVDFPHEGRTYVRVFNDRKRIFRRKGENANNGVDATDCFVVDADGNIENEINWDYPTVSRAIAKRVDDTPITVSGGIFTTIANRWERVYNYHARGFNITRSSVTVSGITHYLEGEGEEGAPYSGFLTVTEAVDVTLENCLLTPHKTYMTKDSNPPFYVNRMGTYELNLAATVRTRLIGIKQTRDIVDTRYWGLIGTNFSKEIYIENCEMSRFDAHMGVSGATITNSRIGHQCLSLIGYGDFYIENSFVLGYSFVSLRADYGSIWHGNITIKNCVWKPVNKGEMWIVNANNTADHDFGYECRMPDELTIDGLKILDDEVNEGAKLYVLPDYDASFKEGKPFPYRPVRKLTVRGIVTEMGRRAIPFARPEEYKDTEIDVK